MFLLDPLIAPLLFRLFNKQASLQPYPSLGYALGFVAFLIALILRWELDSALPPGFPFLTFFPAVILTAFLTGTGPAILCAALSGLTAFYFFIEPVQTFVLTPASAWAMGFYTFIVTIDIALIHVTKTAAQRLRQQQIITAELYQQQRTLFQELQHRIANNLQFVSTLLSLQKRKVKADPASASQVIDDAQARLQTFASIHRKLHDPANSHLPIGQYLQELCTDLINASEARNVVCLVDSPRISFDTHTTLTLSLIVVEVITNSLKHAFIEKDRGCISLNLEALGERDFALTICDNGKGIPEGFDAATSKSLGLRIIQDFARQLQGQINFSNKNGACARLVFKNEPMAVV